MPEMSRPTDPFVIKKHSKIHPYRLAFTIRARLVDRAARASFERYTLPTKTLGNLSAAPEADYHDTAVTPEQMSHLLAALREVEAMPDACIVEVGSWTGVTTRALALATTRTVYAVDPFIMTGKTPQAYERFLTRTRSLPNVVHIRKTSGQAAHEWCGAPAGLIFIDAVHDYYNTRFDIGAWGRILAPGGLLALHDTDQRCFAGTRRAACEAAKAYELFAHPQNLTIFRRSLNSL